MLLVGSVSPASLRAVTVTSTDLPLGKPLIPTKRSVNMPLCGASQAGGTRAQTRIHHRSAFGSLVKNRVPGLQAARASRKSPLITAAEGCRTRETTLRHHRRRVRNDFLKPVSAFHRRFEQGQTSPSPCPRTFEQGTDPSAVCPQGCALVAKGSVTLTAWFGRGNEPLVTVTSAFGKGNAPCRSADIGFWKREQTPRRGQQGTLESGTSAVSAVKATSGEECRGTKMRR